MGWFYVIALQTPLLPVILSETISNYAGCGRMLFFVQMAMQ